jgi:antitoxin ParD1/3/4
MLDRMTAMPTRNINLTDHFDKFVAREIKAGRYRNASEVMRAGLRLLEQEAREDREKLALLRSLASDAFQELDQGKGIKIGSDQDLDKFMGRIGRRVISNEKRQRRVS